MPADTPVVKSEEEMISESQTKKLKGEIEKYRDRVSGFITALDATQIGPDGVDYNNNHMIMFKAAQIFLHFCLLANDIRDICTSTEYSRLKKGVNMIFHSTFFSIAIYQLKIHTDLHYKDYICYERFNNFVKNENGTFSYDAEPVVDDLCPTLSLLFWLRMGVLIVAAAMKVVSIRNSALVGLAGLDNSNYPRRRSYETDVGNSGVFFTSQNLNTASSSVLAVQEQLDETRSNLSAVVQAVHRSSPGEPYSLPVINDSELNPVESESQNSSNHDEERDMPPKVRFSENNPSFSMK